MKTIGSFLSVLWQSLRSSRILILVYAYMLFAYGVAFMYLLRFACDDEEECNALPPVNSTTLLVFPSTYFMTVGRPFLTMERRNIPSQNLLRSMFNHLPFSHTRTTSTATREGCMTLYRTSSRKTTGNFTFYWRVSSSWWQSCSTSSLVSSS